MYCKYFLYIGIRVIVVGVGNSLQSQYVKCLVQSDSDWITVSGYSTAAFNTILGSLSNILCPVSKEFKITEVKAQKRTTENNLDTKLRLGRFVEIYNFGVDFELSDIGISGLIEMERKNSKIPDDVNILQSQYVVFYDAENILTSTNQYASTPTCHLCESDPLNDNKPCDLTNCNAAGSNVYTGTCFCANSIYIACGNTDGYTNCEKNVAISNNPNTYNACQSCIFQDTYINGDQNTAVCQHI